MRLYTPDATRKLLRPTLDRCGYILDYEGQTTALVAAPPHWGTVSVTDVLRALTALNEQFPLGWLEDFPVFIADLQYMYYDGRVWSDTGTVAKTYPKYIIICAQADFDEPRAAMVITHELGHAVMLHLTDSKEFYGKETPMLAAYRKLRNLGPEINYGWTWEDQLYEVFAEDFRWLFGSTTAKLERFRTMDEAVDPKPPDETIRRWFLNLLPKPVSEFHVQVITGKESEQPRMPKMCIDPGHGGSDPGATGPTGLMEKDVNLAVAQRVGYHLRRHGAEVKLTRENDSTLSLAQRCAISNEFAPDVFVSIHCNSADNPTAHGVETWFMPASGRGYGLAGNIQRELVTALKLADRGVKDANFQVLHDTRAPAALPELAFISNPAEEGLLALPEFQEKAAQAVAKGILAYLGVAWQEPPKEKEEINVLFKDVPQNYWAAKDIEAVANAGLMSGYPDGRFGPDEPVTRAQLAAVVNRLLKREG